MPHGSVDWTWCRADGLGFIWLPGCKPYYVCNPAECYVSCSEENKFYAWRVSQNVPFFQSNFELIPGVPAAVGHPSEDFCVETPPELLEEPVVPVSSVEPAVEPGNLGEHSSIAAEVREGAPDEPLPVLSDAVFRARAEAVSMEHRINHFPKHPLCDICNRAKLFLKRIRSHCVPDPESDLPESSRSGEQVASDHVVVSKSSGGKEFLVLVVYDSFSGIVNAYPATPKGSDFVYSCLRHFVLDPNASPALMAGWKLEFGLRFKGVLTLLDYQALREGKIVCVLAPDREVYARDKVTFPLSDVAEKALIFLILQQMVWNDMILCPFLSLRTRLKSERRPNESTFITYSRIQRLGPTPGCRACLAYTSNHIPECVARHEEAHGHASPAPTPGELEELLDEAFPPGLDFEYEPSIAPHGPLDDGLVPECPPPDVFPEDVPAEDEDPIHGVTSGVAVTASIARDAAALLPQDHVQELFQAFFHQGGLGATATPGKKNPKHSKGKHDSSAG